MVIIHAQDFTMIYIGQCSCDGEPSDQVPVPVAPSPLLLPALKQSMLVTLVQQVEALAPTV